MHNSLSELINLTPLILFFGGIYWFLIRERGKKTRARLDQTNEIYHQLKEQILVATSEAIPGKEIREVLGCVTGTSPIEAASGTESEVAEREAMVALMVKALQLGANALIDVRLSSSTQQHGSQWLVTKTYYIGTAVVIH